jgi:hypothetical protein
VAPMSSASAFFSRMDYASEHAADLNGGASSARPGGDAQNAVGVAELRPSHAYGVAGGDSGANSGTP